MIHNVHPTHIQRLNPAQCSLPQSASRRHMTRPSQIHQQGPPPHLNAQIAYMSNQQIQQAQVGIQPNQGQQLGPPPNARNVSDQIDLRSEGSDRKLRCGNSQSYHPNRSNQHFHHHHQQQRTNSGDEVQNSMHSNRHSYHNAQMTSSVGKGSYQYHSNTPIMNGSSRITILHKPTQIEHSAATYSIRPDQPIEGNDNEEVFVEASEEKKIYDMEIKTNLSECNINGDGANKPIAQNKTPMCLINELVRSNKLTHQYRVIGEENVANEKKFTVCLELGNEKYTATGKNIKTAQQAAAAEALLRTKHERVAPRQVRSTFSRKNNTDKPVNVNSITPTVELNSMAMKRGVLVSYNVQYPKSYHEFAAKVQMTNFSSKYRIQNNNNNNNLLRGSGLERHRTTEDDPYHVTVQLGNEIEFNGIGLTLQAAKHDAAAKAIVYWKADPSNGVRLAAAENARVNDSTENSDEAERIKSAISIVQEVAQKRDLPIRFAVKSENGPAHMKHFVITCSVGEMTTSGEGNSKKVAKKHAAEAMVTELQKLPPLPSQQSPPPQNGRRNGRVSKRGIPNANQQSLMQPVAVRRKPRNLIKEILSSDETTPSTTTPATVIVEDEVINPISRLLRMQQAAKKREPIYSVIEERGQQKRKEFVVEVECNGEKAQGVGSNKKLAKRTAAENFLIKMGYPNIELTDIDGSKATVSNGKTPRKVAFQESESYTQAAKGSAGGSVGGSSGRQLVPGVLLIKSQDNLAFEASSANVSGDSMDISKTSAPEASSAIDMHKTPTECGPTAEGNPGAHTNQPSFSGGIRPVNQLLYLAKLLKFEVHFSDFPKGNHSDYLTLASLTTDPPQMFHGSGNSLDASKDQAALSALQTISELGLDNIKTPKAQTSSTATVLTNGKSPN